MKIGPVLLVCAAGTMGAIALGPMSPAFAVCDAYSGACPSTAPTAAPSEVQGNTTAPARTTTVRNRPATTSTTGPATLPVTGGQVVLISTLGLGALAGGTVLVLAGRRRKASTPPAA